MVTVHVEGDSVDVMEAEEMVVRPQVSAWGTWEELILGGAVLRHGTRDWNVVAWELRARTVYPYVFTSEACKAKYEDLRQQYSGCTSWFEELRKRRMAELKKALEKSEDSIGSLESKLKRLKAEKEHYSKVDYNSTQTESPITLPKSEENDSSGRVTSKDGLSASSFTHDAQTTWSPKCQVPAVVSATERQTEPEGSDASELEKALSLKKSETGNRERGNTLQKRRGKRKRKDSNQDAKEGGIEESDNFGSSNVASTSQCKYNSTSHFDQIVRYSDRDGHSKGSCSSQSDTVMGVFNSIAENGSALVFRHRLDSQKRARYKKVIRRHLDMDMIRSRIANCSIKSKKELFRDLLLLANNAIVFYSKRTREYKSGLSLRDNVINSYRQHCNDSINQASSAIFCISPLCNLSRPVKPRSARPRPQPSKCIFSAKLPYAAIRDSDTSEGRYKTSNADSNISPKPLVVAPKKGSSQSGKTSCRTGDQRSKIPFKERKRARPR